MSSALSALHHCRAEGFFVALTLFVDLFICAKDLFIAARPNQRSGVPWG